MATDNNTVLPATRTEDGGDVIAPEEWDKGDRANGYRRSREERAKDIAQIVALQSRNTPVAEIADQISTIRSYKMTAQQVRYDMREIDKILRQKHIRPTDVAEAHELELLKWLEVELKDAWEKSKKDFQSIRVKEAVDSSGNAGAKTKTTTQEKRVGDIAILALLKSIADTRGRWGGFDAAIRIDGDFTSTVEHVSLLNAKRESYKRRLLADARSSITTIDVPPAQTNGKI